MSYSTDCAYHDVDCLVAPFPPFWINSGSCSVNRFLEGQGLFVLGQHIVEDVEEEVNMVLLENKRRTEPDRSISTPTQKDTFVSGLEQDAVACLIITDINGAEGPLSSRSAQYAGVLSL